MKDIYGNPIVKGNILEDDEGRRYKVIVKNGEIHAKSLFKDSGYGEYFLYQDRIERNLFKVIQ